MPQIVGALPTIGKIGQGVTGALGTVSNVIRSNRVNEAQKAALANNKALQNLINNPALLAQKVQSMEQPLNQGLVQGVENQAQAGLAERGLGTSPQIANEVFAQALGPYEQQNRTEALRAILSSYGMSNEAIASILQAEGQPINTSGFWQQLQGKPNIPSLPPETASIPNVPGIIQENPTGGDMAPPAIPGIWPGFPQEGGGDFPGAGDLF